MLNVWMILYTGSPGDFDMAELLAQLPMSPHMPIVSPPTISSPTVMSPDQHSGAGCSGVGDDTPAGPNGGDSANFGQRV